MSILSDSCSSSSHAQCATVLMSLCILGLSMCAMIQEQLLSATKAAVKSLRIEAVPVWAVESTLMVWKL